MVNYLDDTGLQTVLNDVYAELSSKLPISGSTMTGTLVAQSNTDYTTAQVRNVIISADAPSGDAPEGTIWYQYE